MKRAISSAVAIAAMFVAATLVAQTAPQAAHAAAQPGLTLTTTSFEDGGIIPNKFTQTAAPAAMVSPQLAWDYVPGGTVSFVLYMHDPDTALNHHTDEVLHWLMFNIPGTVTSLPEGVPVQAQLSDGSIQLLNRMKAPGYLGPGAPAVGPYHHYTWELFALDAKLSLGPDATLADVQNAMQGHILGKGVLVGRSHRP